MTVTQVRGANPGHGVRIRGTLSLVVTDVKVGCTDVHYALVTGLRLPTGGAVTVIPSTV